MNDKERIANARAYLEAKRLREHAERQLADVATQSYPTDETEARALSFPLGDIRDAQVRMDACLAKLS